MVDGGANYGVPQSPTKLRSIYGGPLMRQFRCLFLCTVEEFKLTDFVLSAKRIWKMSHRLCGIVRWLDRCLWQNRNKLMFERVLMQADAVVSWAGRFLHELLTCNGLDKTTIPMKSPSKLPWQPPRSGVVKVNVDATIHESLDVVRIRVNKGAFLIRMCGFPEWTIETDATNVIRAVKDPVPFALESHIIADIRDVVFQVGSGNVCYASREGNGVAHFLAGLARSSIEYSIWVDCMLRFLGAFVKANLAKI
ncbi:hypothetical protein TIFTF001_002055 [Ficus carica]|uniref:RNase H type-1 domain-containing protein n=1 Tax=Ficus carica TaxID=3494 RepID=A0AA88CSH4_FICCA|nr:hypothetical protein TIFTF001_002055 [Ficus carica]